MGIPIVQPRQAVVYVESRLVFALVADPRRFVAFFCETDGYISADRTEDHAQIAGLRADPAYRAPVVRLFVHRYTQPAIGDCPCGGIVDLDGDASECDDCGATYDSAGNRLDRRCTPW